MVAKTHRHTHSLHTHVHKHINTYKQIYGSYPKNRKNTARKTYNDDGDDISA